MNFKQSSNRSDGPPRSTANLLNENPPIPQEMREYYQSLPPQVCEHVISQNPTVQILQQANYYNQNNLIQQLSYQIQQTQYMYPIFPAYCKLFPMFSNFEVLHAEEEASRFQKTVYESSSSAQSWKHSTKEKASPIPAFSYKLEQFPALGERVQNYQQYSMENEGPSSCTGAIRKNTDSNNNTMQYSRTIKKSKSVGIDQEPMIQNTNSNSKIMDMAGNHGFKKMQTSAVNQEPSASQMQYPTANPGLGRHFIWLATNALPGYHQFMTHRMQPSTMSTGLRSDFTEMPNHNKQQPLTNTYLQSSGGYGNQYNVDQMTTNYGYECGSGEASRLGSCEPSGHDSYEHPSCGLYETSRRGSYEPSRRGSYESSRGQAYEPSRRGSYEPSRRGSYESSRGQAYEPSRRGSYEPSRRGSYESSRGQAYEPSRRGSYEPSRRGSYESSRGQAYEPSRRGSYEPSRRGSYESSRGQAYEPSRRGSYEPSRRGSYESSRGQAYEPSRCGSYEPSRRGSYESSRGQAYEPSRRGSYEPSRRGSYESSRGQAYEPSRRGSYEPSRRGSYESSRGQAYEPSRRGSYEPSRRGSYEPSRRGSYESSRGQANEPSRRGRYHNHFAYDRGISLIPKNYNYLVQFSYKAMNIDKYQKQLLKDAELLAKNTATTLLNDQNDDINLDAQLKAKHDDAKILSIKLKKIWLRLEETDLISQNIEKSHQLITLSCTEMNKPANLMAVGNRILNLHYTIADQFVNDIRTILLYSFKFFADDIGYQINLALFEFAFNDIIKEVFPDLNFN